MSGGEVESENGELYPREHCEGYDKRGYELSEESQVEYIKKHLLRDDNFMETVRIGTQARD